MTIKLTREEAIQDLKAIKSFERYARGRLALDVAIEALEGVCFDEWCDDCKEYDTEKKCCPRFNRVIRGAMKREPSEDEPQDDLISRAEAIETIEIVDWYHQNSNKDMVHGANDDEHQAWYKADDIYKALETVPSAKAVPQSEQYKKGFEDAKRAFSIEYARESENIRKRNAQLEVMLNAQKAISADRPMVIKCKPFLSEEDFKAFAEQVSDQNVILIPYEAEVVSTNTSTNTSTKSTNISTDTLADTVELVRCKDCRHRIHDEERCLYYCEMYYGQGDVSDDNFCQWGAKMDGDMSDGERSEE